MPTIVISVVLGIIWFHSPVFVGLARRIGSTAKAGTARLRQPQYVPAEWQFGPADEAGSELRRH